MYGWFFLLRPHSQITSLSKYISNIPFSFLNRGAGGDCGVSRQARPQLSKSWSEAKGTCESARRRVGREADDLSQARLCLANRPAVDHPLCLNPDLFLGSLSVQFALATTQSCCQPPPKPRYPCTPAKKRRAFCQRRRRGDRGGDLYGAGERVFFAESIRQYLCVVKAD